MPVSRSMRRLPAVGRIAASIGAVVLITALYSQVLHVNPTTIALSYLIAIMLIATGWDLVEATASSIVAVLCFNFFFLPPIGTFTIVDPQNWIAFIAFLIAAVSHAIGSDSQRPFAIVIVGGLMVGLVLSVFLLPTLYVWVARNDDVLPVAEME